MLPCVKFNKLLQVNLIWTQLFGFLFRVMLLGNIYLVVGYAEYERVFVLSRSSLKKGM